MQDELTFDLFVYEWDKRCFFGEYYIKFQIELIVTCIMKLLIK